MKDLTESTSAIISDDEIEFQLGMEKAMKPLTEYVIISNDEIEFQPKVMEAMKQHNISFQLVDSKTIDEYSFKVRNYDVTEVLNLIDKISGNTENLLECRI